MRQQISLADALDRSALMAMGRGVVAARAVRIAHRIDCASPSLHPHCDSNRCTALQIQPLAITD
jgi:hypothetical protein